MSAKIQSVQDKSNMKGLGKKIRCGQHRQKYVFKCEYPNCQTPFICPALECIQNHIHEQKITMTKFNFQSISNKFFQVDGLVTDDTIYQNAKTLKSCIDGLKQSIKNVFVGIKGLNQNYDYLKGDLEGPLNLDYISKVQQTYALNQTVRKTVDQLKDKIKIEFPVKDSYFSLRSHLIQFLSQNIQGFNWGKSKQLHSSKSDLITCQKFHQKLAGVTDLLFIFVGESKIVGSYYASQYPTLAQKSKKDLKSFLFISKKQLDCQHFLKFQACQQTDQHIVISQKNLICHGNTASYGDGIRTFHKNFDNIQYCLPSNTYKLNNSQTSVSSSSQQNQQIFNGTLKVRRFMILQAYRQKITRNDELEQPQGVLNKPSKQNHGNNACQNGSSHESNSL